MRLVWGRFNDHTRLSPRDSRVTGANVVSPMGDTHKPTPLLHRSTLMAINESLMSGHIMKSCPTAAAVGQIVE